jgi:hypothetical protein
MSSTSSDNKEDVPTSDAVDPPTDSTSSSATSWLGSTIDNVKKTAVGQYENFKSANPDLAKTIEGAVGDVAAKVDDLHLQQKEKSAKAELDKVMAKLETELQAVQKMAWDDYNKYWPSSKAEAMDDVQKAQKAINDTLVTAQASIAQTKKNAIASLQQAMDTAMVTRETKLEADYQAALKSAQEHYDKLKKVGGEASAKISTKIETGLAEAQNKVQAAKTKGIELYETALKDVQTNLATVGKQITDEFTKLEAVIQQDATAVAKQTHEALAKAGKVTLDAANAALVAVAGPTKASAIKSELEKDYKLLKDKVGEDCSNLKAYSLAKAEDFETTIRGHITQVSTVKKTATLDYHKALEKATSDLKSLTDA